MIKLEFSKNSTGHDDINFAFFEYQQVCDSYYFFIDSNFSNEENIEKFIQVFNKLLNQWITYIKLLGESDIVYLPFDFSDQYTGCLQVAKRSNNLEITPGWSQIEGWRVFPSDISDYVKSVNDFKATYPAKLMQIDETLALLEQCLIRIKP